MAQEIVDGWLNKLKLQGIEFTEDRNNIFLLVGFIGNQFGGVVSEANLDSAAKSLWAVLKFKKGFEMPDPRAAENEKAARLKKKEDLNAMGLGSHRTELDRDDGKDDKAKEDTAKKTQLSREQFEAKAEFERICNVYSVTRAGRISHSKTAERREQLRSISITKSNRPDDVAMLQEAKAMLHQFEVEDSKRST